METLSLTTLTCVIGQTDLLIIAPTGRKMLLILIILSLIILNLELLQELGYSHQAVQLTLQQNGTNISGN
ncbi:MAG: hypothetical protein IPG39_17265 [Bacteroidetes bacterium]|nr:hypothetical protein [Bacteroidota bacterium]